MIEVSDMSKPHVIVQPKDLGSITVYGDARTGGYQGTKQDLYTEIFGHEQGKFIVPVDPEETPTGNTLFIRT